MTGSLRYVWGPLALLGASVLFTTVPGRAQDAVKEIYTGQPVAMAGLKLGGWGSGKAKEERQAALTGDMGIRVTTNGFYAGGRIIFNEPLDLTRPMKDPYGFLLFTVKFPDAAGGGGDAFGSGDPIQPSTKRLKVVLEFAEGRMIAANHPMVLFPKNGQDGWFETAIPIVSFKAANKKMETYNLKEIQVFGDTTDTIDIGEIRTTVDDEPIAVEPLEQQTVSVNEVVTFEAKATAGISTLKYSWDFDSSDGSNDEDATGTVVDHVFRRASRELPNNDVEPIIVTLTVTDISGAKKPERRICEVIVNR